MRCLPFLFVLACSDPPGAPVAAPPAVEVVPLEALVAAARSPRAEPPESPVRLSVSMDAVHLDGLTESLAGAPEAPLPGLAAALAPLKGRPLVVRAAADVPYERVARVLATAHLAGLRSWFVETTNGLIPLDQARACVQPATASKPCTTTWAQVTPKEIFIQNRGLAEVGCGPPIAAAPLPTAELVGQERGRCRRLMRREGKLLLGIIAPHIDRHIQGDRCDMATLSAWPEVPWGDVVAAADALRSARHPRIALGIDRGRTDCRSPGPLPPLEGVPTIEAPR